MPSPATSSDSDKPSAAGKVLTVSLTLVIPNEDVPLALYDATAQYLQQHTKAGSISTERGGAFKHLHIQGVYKKRGTSTQALKKDLLQFLSSHVQNFAALNISCCLKKATNKGLHTFEGLVGYSLKYEGRDDFHNTLHNVSSIEIEEGRKLLLQYGAVLKHRIPLTLHNVMERAASYMEYELRGRFCVTLPCIVYAMIRSGQYYMDPEWAVPYKGQGMEASRSHVVWLSCIAPSSLSLQNISDVLYRAPDRYFTDLHNGAAGSLADDDVLVQLVQDAANQGRSIGALIDARPALRPLLYARSTDPVLTGQQQRIAAADNMTIDCSEIIAEEGVAYGMLS